METEPRPTNMADELAAALADLAKVNSALTSEQIAHGKTMRERDELLASMELVGNALLHAEINPNNYSHEEVLVLNDAASTAFQLADRDGAPRALAAHDRAVAARVLRALVDGAWRGDQGVQRVLDVAAEYEAGEKEAPNA